MWTNKQCGLINNVDFNKQLDRIIRKMMLSYLLGYFCCCFPFTEQEVSFRIIETHTRSAV